MTIDDSRNINSEPVRIGIEPEISVDEFIDILQRSTLAERRPVDDRDTIQGMINHASIIATARLTDGQLVGIARSITDFHYCTYLSDLAVDIRFQRRGIGKQLIEFSHAQAGSKTTLIVLAAPAATSYYPRVGMKRHSSCWIKHAPADVNRSPQ